jgi:hypothetical protein
MPQVAAERVIEEAEAAEIPFCEQIALLAHQLWEQRGCPEGSPEEDWFRAEQELAARRD